MTIVLVGLNHRTTPIELREKLSLTGSALQNALEKLKTYQSTQQDGITVYLIDEGVILSTCNRLEIYAVVNIEHKESGWELIENFLANLQNLPLEEVKPHLYYYAGLEAVQHLMRVACGLDSMILGESQILGQVTQSFIDVQHNGLVGSILSQVMSQAIHAGKRARTETEISHYTTSVSHAGALLVLDKVGVSSPNILIVGAGEMAILAAKSLHKHSDINLAFINRTFSHAEALASELDGKSLSWYQLAEALEWADAVITATGAPHLVIYAEDVEQILASRQERPLLFVDIAVPRDVEITVEKLSGVQRYDIDDLQSIVDTNTNQRQVAIPHVEMIVEQEMDSFSEWYHSRQVVPVITDLRRWATQIAQQEVEQAVNKINNVDEHTEKIINRLAHRLVNKLLHEPTIQLRGQAANGNGIGYAHVVSELFGLQGMENNTENIEESIEI